jgi:hypothetical protein
MSGRPSPSESYEPTEFEIIDENTFNKIHPYQEGSSIILKNLKPTDPMYNVETGNRLIPEQFEELLSEQLGKVYRELIDKVIIINVNDVKVTPRYDLVKLIPDTHKNTSIFHVELDNNNEPREIYRENITSNGRTYISKFYQISSTFESNKSTKEDFVVFAKKSSVVTLKLTSLTTKKTNYENIVSYDITDIVRGGRDFGESKITKQEKDGYSNHIYHRIDYKSKRLNPIIGVGSNKRVNIKSNMLMTAIHVTEKERTTKFRKFCKEGTHQNESESDYEDTASSVVTTTNKRSSKKKPKTNATSLSFSVSESIATFTSPNIPSSNIAENLQNISSLNVETELQQEIKEEPEIEVHTEIEQQSEIKVELDNDINLHQYQEIQHSNFILEQDENITMNNVDDDNETVNVAEPSEEEILINALDKIVSRGYSSFKEFLQQDQCEKHLRLYLSLYLNKN